MTVEQWRASDDPAAMVAFLREELADRQARHFAAACCREVWELLVDERSRAAVEIAEQFADRGVRISRRLARAEAEAWAAAGARLTDPGLGAAALTAVSARRRGRWWLSHQTAWGTISAEAVPAGQEAAVRGRQANLLGDITGPRNGSWWCTDTA